MIRRRTPDQRSAALLQAIMFGFEQRHAMNNDSAAIARSNALELAEFTGGFGIGSFAQVDEEWLALGCLVEARTNVALFGEGVRPTMPYHPHRKVSIV